MGGGKNSSCSWFRIVLLIIFLNLYVKLCRFRHENLYLLKTYFDREQSGILFGKFWCKLGVLDPYAPSL